MDWLFANPVADLSGPAFLLVYALIAIGIVVASRMQIAAADTSGKGPPPAVSVERDPYEVAYLRGGGNELLRFTVFDLVRAGILRIGDPPKPNKPPNQLAATGLASGALSTLGQQVVAFYQIPHTGNELFASPLPAAAKVSGAAFDARLGNERLLAGPEVRAAAARVRLYGSFALIALALYRLANAFVKHHNNVVLLIVEAVVALVVLTYATNPPRLSRYGRSYLDRLATAVRPTPVAPLAAGAGLP